MLHLTSNKQNQFSRKRTNKNRNYLECNHFLAIETLNSLALVHHCIMNYNNIVIKMYYKAKYVLESQEQNKKNLIDLAITLRDIRNYY